MYLYHIFTIQVVLRFPLKVKLRKQKDERRQCCWPTLRLSKFQILFKERVSWDQKFGKTHTHTNQGVALDTTNNKASADFILHHISCLLHLIMAALKGTMTHSHTHVWEFDTNCHFSHLLALQTPFLWSSFHSLFLLPLSYSLPRLTPLLEYLFLDSPLTPPAPSISRGLSEHFVDVGDEVSMWLAGSEKMRLQFV